MICNSKWRILCLSIVFLLIFSVASAFAGRNVCDKCKWIGTPDARICESCQSPLNLCLDCMHENEVKADYCVKCGMPMAEMRVLGSIDPDLRRELRLGESVRARAELDIQRLKYLMQINPENAEEYSFDLAMRHREIHFYSRESQLWLAFLERYPNSEKVSLVKSYASDSLLKWAYLMYGQEMFTVAIELLNESLRLNPGNSEARLWLGNTYKALGQAGEAAKAFRQASLR
ncbi:MAG: hypothetical protein ACD_39C01722G0001 [uncultured bacterium]|nr:MAG: hypothetical protein ACD_39C01722G0001 [uncultured bacterium]